MLRTRKIGIIGAMPEEINGIIDLLSDRTEETIGLRKYYSGTIGSIPTVVAFSRWGKVAASTTATTLVLNYGITELVFTGVAGGISPELKIGDIVLGKRLIQHDMDARPLMQQYEIPLLGKTFIECNTDLVKIAEKSILQLLGNNLLQKNIGSESLNLFNITHPHLFKGDIASGDCFFSNNNQKEKLRVDLPSVLSVEMEGAAVAQVCFEYEIPFLIIRTISDSANENSLIDFPLFIKDIASKYSKEIIKAIYANIT